MAVQNSNKNRKKMLNILSIAFLSIFGLLLMAPFIWMISVSLDKTSNIAIPYPPRFIPEEFSFFNYKLVFENGTLLKTYINSFIVALGTVFLNVSAALLAGYAFSKGQFKGKKFFFVFILSTMMIPKEITIVPMYVMFNKLGWLNTFAPLILPGLLFGFGIILSKQFFDKLPDSLREAALIDGVGELKIFYYIFLPLTGPITATMSILSFMYSWNSFLWPMIVLTDHKLHTVPIFLSTFAAEDGSRLAGSTMALATASILPILLVFLFLQKYVIQSVALSGLKGE